MGNLTREVLENKNILDNFHSLRDKLFSIMAVSIQPHFLIADKIIINFLGDFQGINIPIWSIFCFGWERLACETNFSMGLFG